MTNDIANKEMEESSKQSNVNPQCAKYLLAMVWQSSSKQKWIVIVTLCKEKGQGFCKWHNIVALKNCIITWKTFCQDTILISFVNRSLYLHLSSQEVRDRKVAIKACEHKSKCGHHLVPGLLSPPSHVVAGSLVRMLVSVPMEWMWARVSPCSWACLWLWRQNISQHLLHGAGVLQSKESRRSVQETLWTLWTRMEERGKELYVQEITLYFESKFFVWSGDQSDCSPYCKFLQSRSQCIR